MPWRHPHRRALNWAGLAAVAAVIAFAQDGNTASISPGPVPDLTAAAAPSSEPPVPGRFYATTVDAHPLTWAGRCGAPPGTWLYTSDHYRHLYAVAVGLQGDGVVHFYYVADKGEIFTVADDPNVPRDGDYHRIQRAFDDYFAIQVARL